MKTERAAKAAKVEAAATVLITALGEWRAVKDQQAAEVTGRQRAMLKTDEHIAHAIVVRLRQVLEDKRSLSELVNGPVEALDVVDARQVDSALS